MEVRDGFIIGVYNYCDRWCETCVFTSRCRVFADIAETEAAFDPALREVVNAPPLPQEIPPPPPQWVQELFAAMNAACRETTAQGRQTECIEPPFPPDHQAIEARARSYSLRVHEWLRGRELLSARPADPAAVIRWFRTLIDAKIHRAMHSFAEYSPAERDWPADHDGSAKVALIGIDRSHAAWLDLIDQGVVAGAEALPFIADLVWLGDALERVFPNARAFVRPAFDEPEEVAKLLASEGL